MICKVNSHGESSVELSDNEKRIFEATLSILA